MDHIARQCGALAADIRQSREAILQAWHQSVETDPELTKASSITRSQFTDSVPKILDAFELALRANDALHKLQANIEQRDGASEHGLQRWQQGYDLRETMREWAHLQSCILAHLERYSVAHPELDPAVMQRARTGLVWLCGEGACESAARYTRLQQAEAAGRMRDLEAIVQELRSVEKNRIEMLREAAHDLRGSVGIITNASAVLARSTSEEMRHSFYRILDRAIHSTRSLLSDLIDLTRLEAGQDRLQIAPFDVSEVLRDLAEPLRAEAGVRGLFLKLDGPDSMPVIGDRVKVQRIVQNLVLNALKATAQGGVTLRWSGPAALADPRWVLEVEDTGPGLQGSHATPLTRALSEATEQIQEEAEKDGSGEGRAPMRLAPASARPQMDKATEPGEGIGLSIVKRLCELLNAAIELQSDARQGTLFRLSFPAQLTPASTEHADRAAPAGDSKV